MDSLNIRIAIGDRVLDFVDRAGRTHELNTTLFSSRKIL
jgi:hypothetical protein